MKGSTDASVKHCRESSTYRSRGSFDVYNLEEPLITEEYHARTMQIVIESHVGYTEGRRGTELRGSTSAAATLRPKEKDFHSIKSWSIIDRVMGFLCLRRMLNRHTPVFAATSRAKAQAYLRKGLE